MGEGAAAFIENPMSHFWLAAADLKHPRPAGWRVSKVFHLRVGPALVGRPPQTFFRLRRGWVSPLSLAFYEDLYKTESARLSHG